MNTNNLPPLPEMPSLFTTTGKDWRDSHEAYGQLCRQQALEEAAKLAEAWDRPKAIASPSYAIRSMK